MTDRHFVRCEVVQVTEAEKWQRYRERRRTFGLREVAIDREIVFAKIIDRWNDEGRFWGGLVACGGLGVAYIHWIHGWEVKWFELEPLPEGVEVP